ncbi:MAG: metal ABC transporter solute-binding protein, Zn/Mn family, partial [Geminicoccaceae bacterium]
ITPLSLEDEHEEGAAHEDEEEHGHDHHRHGDEDPHAWHSLANGAIYASNIEEGLSAADPNNADTYREHGERYRAEIRALDQEVRQSLDALPAERRKIVTPHDAFGYFADSYDLTFLAPQGLSTESEASAAAVATLIRQVRDEQISAIFIENVADSRLIEQITRETDAVIGGTLYSDALSAEDGPASTYLDMLRHNVGAITAALGS